MKNEIKYKTLEKPGEYVSLDNKLYEGRCFDNSNKAENRVEEFSMILRDIPNKNRLKNFILALENEEI